MLFMSTPVPQVCPNINSSRKTNHILVSRDALSISFQFTFSAILGIYVKESKPAPLFLFSLQIFVSMHSLSSRVEYNLQLLMFPTISGNWEAVFPKRWCIVLAGKRCGWNADMVRDDRLWDVYCQLGI